jgi:hypothetical protein
MCLALYVLVVYIPSDRRAEECCEFGTVVGVGYIRSGCKTEEML